MQEEMQKFQQNLGQITAEGDAGGGVVKVRVNGRMEVLSCQLLDFKGRLDLGLPCALRQKLG